MYTQNRCYNDPLLKRKEKLLRSELQSKATMIICNRHVLPQENISKISGLLFGSVLLNCLPLLIPANSPVFLMLRSHGGRKAKVKMVLKLQIPWEDRYFPRNLTTARDQISPYLFFSSTINKIREFEIRPCIKYNVKFLSRC